jgi:hypothetical protein
VRYPLAVLANQEYRELKFDEYVAVVEAALKDRVLEEARGTITFPEELRILFELGVDGLNGIGLQIWQGMFGCAFWDGLGQGNLEDVDLRVQGPDTKIERWGVSVQDYFPGGNDAEPDKWRVAGGWGIGSGCAGQICCAVFCRRIDEKQFAWRYTIGDEYDTQMFDTIPQLLDYYKDYEQYSIDSSVGEYANEEGLFWWYSVEVLVKNVSPE